MSLSDVRIKNGTLPDLPGVYLFMDEQGSLLYVGKATSLLRRVSSYFQRPQNDRLTEMVSKIRRIDYIEQSSALEALILEANLIQAKQPPYNVLGKDRKSFLYVVITKDEYPRVEFIRGLDFNDTSHQQYKAVYGPYTSGRSLKAAMDIIRRAIPWSTCRPDQKRQCFDAHMRRCPGVCVRRISPAAYGKMIRDLRRFLEGKKGIIVKSMQRAMKSAAHAKEFERAGELRNKIFFFEHIQDVAMLKREDEEDAITSPDALVYGRVEGFDISNTSGASSVASMVVFEHGAPSKTEYRKFRIKYVQGPNDVASLQEVIVRRFRHTWKKPSLLLIDGGKPQVNAVCTILEQLGITVPVVGLAKGPNRDRNELIVPTQFKDIRPPCEKHLDVLIRVRDEAHRFAIAYHRKLRDSSFSRRRG